MSRWSRIAVLHLELRLLVIDYYCRIEDSKADDSDGRPTVPGTRPGDRDSSDS